jgi:hypothetical protein
MTAPRIFLSSTCYDLSSTRSSLDAFLKGLGFEVLNSESGTFGVTPKKHSHNACLDQVANADYLVLIIGGRRGGTFVGSTKAITNEEFREAQKRSIPVIAFVDRRVNALLPTYRKNPKADFTDVVDDVRVFDFIAYVMSGHEDNWLHEYGSATDIQNTLRAQFAYYLYLYSRSLRPSDHKNESNQVQVAVPFPSDLSGVDRLHGKDIDAATGERAGLRSIYEILAKIIGSKTAESAKQEKLKVLWLLGLSGENRGSVLRMPEPEFKDNAWGTSRGKRVNQQLLPFGVGCEYDVDSDGKGGEQYYFRLWLPDVEDSEEALGALQTYVSTLVKTYGEDDGLELFKRADMRVFSEAAG